MKKFGLFVCMVNIIGYIAVSCYKRNFSKISSVAKPKILNATAIYSLRRLWNERNFWIWIRMQEVMVNNVTDKSAT